MYQDGYNYYSYPNYQPFYNEMPRGFASPTGGMGAGVRRSGGLAGLFRRGGSSTANLAGIAGAAKPKFNWGGLLTNTQKTLNVINQAIPIFYQVRPIWNNAKTMFHIMGALKEDDDKPNPTSSITKSSASSSFPSTDSSQATETMENQPQFFI